MRSFPSTVSRSEPAAPIDMRTTGVHDRHTMAVTTAKEVAMIVIPIVPPRLVNQVTAWSRPGDRRPTMTSRTGTSRLARSSFCVTAS